MPDQIEGERGKEENKKVLLKIERKKKKRLNKKENSSTFLAEKEIKITKIIMNYR